MNLINTTGKRALVFGGTSGIGLAAARLLKESGADVTVFGRSEAKIEACTAEGLKAHSIDVLDRSALEKLFADNAGFDYLVSAATGGDRAIGPFMKMDLDGFQGSFAKMWGYAAVCRLGIDHMAEDGSDANKTQREKDEALWDAAEKATLQVRSVDASATASPALHAPPPLSRRDLDRSSLSRRCAAWTTSSQARAPMRSITPRRLWSS